MSTKHKSRADVPETSAADAGAPRKHEGRQRLLLKLADALRSLGEPQRVHAEAAKQLGVYLQVDRAFYADVDDDANVLLAFDYCSEGTHPLAGRYRLDDFGVAPAAAMRAGRTLVVTDLQASREFTDVEKQRCRELGIGAALVVPLVKDGKLTAFFALHQSQPRNWTRGEAALTTEVSKRTWSAVERARAEVALRANEEKYRSLFDSIDQGACVMEVEYAADGRIAELYFREVNAAFERQGGFHHAVGKPVSRFMPNLEQYWRDAHIRAMKDGRPTRVENYLADRERWFSVQFSRIGGPGSRLLAAVFEDITERKRNERMTNRLAAIVESSDDAIISKGLDGIIQTWNKGAERIFGYTAEEAIGRPVTILMPPDRLDEEPGILARISRGERIEHHETVRQRKDGSRLDVSLTISPVRNRHGQVVAASKIARDISQRKHVEASLRESERQLQHANRAKDEFIAMLSHELRNPLAPIATTLQLMKLRAPEVFTRERGIIEAQVRDLTGLVDDLLDVARIARGKVELRTEAVAVGEIATAAVENTQTMLEERRQSLHMHIQEDLMVLGDQRRLVQVLVNLLGNASKYSPPGSMIRLSAVAENGLLVLRVCDQGQGIAPELLPHVFDLFTQDAQTIDRSHGGLGLGLAIVRNLAMLHGGSVEAASEGRGKGSEFTLHLPLLERWHERAGDGADDATAVPLEPDESRPRTRVLIVDDYAPAAESLALLLREMGYRTRVAYDGATGLRAIAEYSPDVALVDIGLPVMDGYEVARSVRSTPGCEHLPLVAVTGYGQPGDRTRVMEAGFDEHLVKPLNADKIGELIDSLIGAA